MTAGPSEESLRGWLRETIRDIMDAPQAASDGSIRFRELGLGSSQLLELLARLSKHVGVPLAQTLAWEYPTPAALARHVARAIQTPSGTGASRTVVAAGGREALGVNEPIAVVGMACRLPGGVDSPSAFWALLTEKRHGIREVPTERWDIGSVFDEDVTAPGKSSTRWGGFIDAVDRFDADFFGISPREARQMDPQQRLVLELAWEALEDAATNPLELRDRPVGVFVGAMWNDYASLTNANLAAVDQHTSPGVDTSIVSARVSYQLGLQGPSLTVNTACSSSLVAIHLACRSIRFGESEMALAGGVNLMLSPSGYVGMSKFGAMNPAGQCRAFDAGANGYVRGEGAGLVVLKPLQRALADGDRIYCVIRGSAVNNDGFSNGLTAPNPRAQEAVLAQACADAKVEPESIEYVEAHGPGTILGDPIEAGALGVVFGAQRSKERPLRIGSVKTNIGHLEPAAGVAGLMKTALALHHGMWPPSLNFDTPNPRIPFDDWNLKVQTVAEPIRTSEPARAGVSSFGFGGTNCHVVLEAIASASATRLIPLAAASQEQWTRRAAELSKRFAQTLSASEEATLFRTIATSAENEGPFRRAVIVRAGGVAAALASAAKPTGPTSDKPRIVFVFPGHGAQWLGMGRSLLTSEPVFRAEIEACDRIVKRLRGWSIIDELAAPPTSSQLEDGEVVQILLFSMMVSLAALWRSFGVVPAVVVGHSLGEIAAAFVAGALSREDALLIIAERGRLTRDQPSERGAMLAVGAAEGALSELLKMTPDLSIAAFNGPASLVLAGTLAAIEASERDLTRRGIKNDRVQIRYASHCAMMDPLVTELCEKLRNVAPRAGSIRLRSTTRDAWLSGEELDAEHWGANLRTPVLFRHAIQAIAEEEPCIFVEVSSHPLLRRAIEQAAGSVGRTVKVLPSCWRGEDERESLLTTLGALFEAGLDPRWDAVRGEDRRPAQDCAANSLPFLLSGKSEDAVRAQAERLREHIEAHAELPLADIAYSLASKRAQFEHRAAVVAHDRSQLLVSLAALAGGQADAHAVVGRTGSNGKVVFVFPGHGAQWDGMALALLDSSPVFRVQLEACERALAPHVDWSLLAILRGDDNAPPLDRVDVVQPVLFSVVVSLAALWRSHGIIPDAVVGHSFGEIAAAFVAGALTLEDAAKIVALRGRVLAPFAGRGAMAAVELGLAALQPYLEPYGKRLSIGVINSLHSTVVSGDPAAIDSLLDELTAAQVRAQKVRIAYASHSAQVESARDELLTQLATVSPRSGEIPFYSTVTGAKLDGAELDAAYWYRNLRQTVRFADTTDVLLDDDHRFFVEVSPHPILKLSLLDSFEHSALDPVVVGSLQRGHGDLGRILLALSELYCNGRALDWLAFFAPLRPRLVALPTYAFQRESYWLASPKRQADIASVGLTSADHPLLGATVLLADGGSLFTGCLSLSQHPWLADHVVFGTVLLPGTAFLELALVAAQRVGFEVVDELTLEAPLALPVQGAVILQISVSPPDDSGRRSLTFHSHPQDAPQEVPWTRHATATLAAGVGAKPLDFDLRAWPPPDATSLAIDYQTLASSGLAYGPAFQGLRAAWKRGDELFAEVKLPAIRAAESSGFALHPALLDAALHALFLEPGGAVALPFSWSGVVLRSVGAGAMRVHFRQTSSGSTSLSIADDTGEPVASIEALITRPCTAQQLRGAVSRRSDAFLRLEWSEQSVAAALPKPKKGAFLRGPNFGLPTSVAFDRFVDLSALEAALDQGVWAADLVLAPLFSVPPTPNVVTAAHVATANALALLQRWVGDPRLASTSLVLVTRRSVATQPGEDVLDLSCAPLSGLVRSALAEFPDAPIFLVDLDHAPDSHHALNVLLSSLDTNERIFALRDGRRLVPRLARLRPEDTLIVPDAATWNLQVPAKGTLEALTLSAQPGARAPLGHRQVRVAVRAAGINFRDVLDTLGMYPGDPGPLGLEGAGIITEVGPGVRDFAVADRVMGIFSAAFGPVAIADVRMIARLPAAWSFVEGASVPVVFLTAYYGLCILGRLEPGQRLLVHAAAGGVGTAAVQLARHLGAEVFATASPGKHGSLRALGFDQEHLASSRDLTFEQHFVRSTQGLGMDVVLDCLAHEFVDASLRLMPRGGHFVEMGKSDIRDATAVGAAHPGVIYRAFDVFDAGPDQIGKMLAELLPLFERGTLRPPPITVWDVRQARQAFRALGQAKQIGKFVLTLPRRLRPEGTILVTGGTGTLGALLARHLVNAHGAKHLVLVSRQGASAVGASTLRRELEAAGALVTIAACDVSDRAALEAVLNDIPAAHPLTAVVHTAGTLDDGVLDAMTPERIDRVFRPKLDAAWHLHELTKTCDLSAFVVFSSVLGVLGAAGQSNYTAANAFLDGLAQHRVALGLPGSSLAWGFWADRSGITGHLSTTDSARLARMGLIPIAADFGLALFDAALERHEPSLVATRFDFPRLGALDVVHPLLQGLVRPRLSQRQATNTTSGASLTQRLLPLDSSEQDEALLDLVRAEAASVLGLPGSSPSLEPNRPFAQLGFDSLMAVELRNRLGRATALRLQVTLLFEHPTPAALSRYIATQLLDR